MYLKLKKAGFFVVAIAVLSLPANVYSFAGKKTAQAPPALKVGDVAPDFTMTYFDGHDDKQISLHDYRGKKNVVLAFYVFAFTGG